MKNINIVVVGPGLIGKKHIALIGERSDVRLCSIVAPDHAVNHELAKKLNVKLYFDVDTCIKDENPDGIIIASPNEFHFEQASKCIKFGIPVLIEKPITANLKEARDLVNLTQCHNAKVLVGHHRNYSPLLFAAKEEINSGHLGQIVSVIGSAQFYKPKQYFLDGPWRGQPGGGPLLINMIHEIGNMRTLIGEINAVQAVATARFRKFPVEETVAINLAFENGVLGTFLISDTAASCQSWEQTSYENPAYPQYPSENCYTITGTRGTLYFPTMKIHYHEAGSEASWWKPMLTTDLAVVRKDPLKCQLNHFVAVINGQEEVIVTAKDGYKNLLIIEAIKKSIEEETLINVEP
jgi:predicted dehydrogenase